MSQEKRNGIPDNPISEFSISENPIYQRSLFWKGRARLWIKPKDYQLVGAALAEARKSAGVSQDELSARLKKPQSFVSSYERGQRRVDLLEFLAIAEALKLDPLAVFEKAAAAVRPENVSSARKARHRG